MKPKCTLAALVAAWMMCVALGAVPALAGADAAQLDVEAARSNLAQWMAKREKASPAEVRKRIDIQKVVPVKDAPVPLFAVRLAVAAPAGVEAVPTMGVMILDASGRYRFKGMTGLATGADLMFAAQQEAMRFDLPEDFGRVLGNFGGPHDVVVVSDAFCPHCRKAWADLKSLRSRIGTLRVVHLPLVGHEGAEALGWALDFAAEKGMDAVSMADYAMGFIDPPGGGLFRGMDAAVGALESLFAKYPDLRRRMGAPEAAWEQLRARYAPDNGRDRQRCWRMGLGSVPSVFVDGVLMRGYDGRRLKAMLAK